MTRPVALQIVAGSVLLELGAFIVLWRQSWVAALCGLLVSIAVSLRIGAMRTIAALGGRR